MDRTENDAAPDAPAAIAARELLPGERLQWAARPRPWAVARQQLAALPIGLVLLAVGAVAAALAPRAMLAPGDALTSLPRSVGTLLALFGVALACAPLVAALLARGTVYAITTRRLLVIERAFMHRVAAFAPDDIQAIVVTNERPDGSAAVVFRQEIRHVPLRGRYRVVKKIGFFGIADAERVRALIRALRGNLTDAPGPPAS